jgi:hypothetical protein
MDIKYDTPVEVTKKQHEYLRLNYPMIIAHSKVDGKFYIKLWNMNFKKEIESYLKKAT